MRPVSPERRRDRASARSEPERHGPDSSLTMTHDTIRCPACGSLDWFRDGFRIRELHEGDLERRRTAIARDGAGPWICERCLHRAPVWGYLAGQLNAAQIGTEGEAH